MTASGSDPTRGRGAAVPARPLLVILTLPITVVTVGLFYPVVHGLAAALVPGFSVDSVWWAILGALVASLVSLFVGAVAKSE